MLLLSFVYYLLFMIPYYLLFMTPYYLWFTIIIYYLPGRSGDSSADRGKKQCNCRKKTRLHIRRYIQSNFGYGKNVLLSIN